MTRKKENVIPGNKKRCKHEWRHLFIAGFEMGVRECRKCGEERHAVKRPAVLA